MHWVLWPFYAIWCIVTSILKLVGRILCAVIGLVLMIVGALLCMTLILWWIGAPIAAFGLLLVIRALF